MSLQSEIIKELNDLSLQYSRWFISYDDFKKKRHDLLNKLESIDSGFSSDRSVIKNMVNTFSDLIKRS